VSKEGKKKNKAPKNFLSIHPIFSSIPSNHPSNHPSKSSSHLVYVPQKSSWRSEVIEEVVEEEVVEVEEEEDDDNEKGDKRAIEVSGKLCCKNRICKPRSGWVKPANTDHHQSLIQIYIERESSSSIHIHIP